MRAQLGDIVHPSTEAIVIEINGTCFLHRGECSRVSQEAGDKLKTQVQKIARASHLEPGHWFSVPSGDLRKRGIKQVYFVVTTKFIGGLASLHCLTDPLRQVLESAINENLKSIAITGLGVRQGGLDGSAVARTLVQAAKDYDNQIDIVFLDTISEFIDSVKKFAKLE